MSVLLTAVGGAMFHEAALQPSHAAVGSWFVARSQPWLGSRRR